MVVKKERPSLALLFVLLATVGATKCSHTTCRLARGSVLKVRHHNSESICGKWQTLAKGSYEKHDPAAQKQCAVVPGTGLACECHLLGTHPGSHFRGAPPTRTVKVVVEMRPLDVGELTQAVEAGIKTAVARLARVTEARVLVRNARNVRVASAMTRRRLTTVEPGWKEALQIASSPTHILVVDVLVNFWTSESAASGAAKLKQAMSSSAQARAFSRSIRQRVLDTAIAAGAAVEGLAHLQTKVEDVTVLSTPVFASSPQCKGGTVLTKDCANYAHGNNHQVTSSRTCAELGWATKHGHDARVCAASHCRGQLAQQMAGGKAALTTFDEAKRLCRGDGARLCTVGELEANEAAGTGCSLDHRRVWSSSPCGSGRTYLQLGRSKAGSDKVCTEHSAGTGHVRCCADVEVTLPTPAATTQDACVAACEVSEKCAGWAHSVREGGHCFLLDAEHLQLGATPHSGFFSAACTDNEVCTVCKNQWQVRHWHAPPAHPCEIESCHLGSFLNTQKNACETCPNAFVATEWVEGQLCKIKQCAQEEGWRLNAQKNKCERCSNSDSVAAWLHNTNCRVVQCAAEAFLDPWNNRCERIKAKWKKIFARGRPGSDFNIGASEFQELAKSSLSRMVKRVCPTCAKGYRTVIYKRKGERLIDYNRLFHMPFPAFSNKLHDDFEVYSSVTDAEADKNRWQRCEYGLTAPMFPYACTKDAAMTPQHPADGTENFSLFLDVSQFHERSRILPMLRWKQVFGAGPRGREASRKTCAELGWTTKHGRRASVCGASHCDGRLAQQTSSKAFTTATYDEAQEICHGEGARLCTAQELESDEVATTGCGLDAKRIWSSTSCAWGKSFVLVGRSTKTDGKQKEVCADHSSNSGHIRCCADDTNNFDVGAKAFQAAIEQSQYRLIKRTCLECADDFREVVYLRTGPTLPDYWSYFHTLWRSTDNLLHRHFELFSSTADALARRSMWGWCTYDDHAAHVRNATSNFPFMCGKAGEIPHDWNTLSDASRKSHAFAFYVSN